MYIIQHITYYANPLDSRGVFVSANNTTCILCQGFYSSQCYSFPHYLPSLYPSLFRRNDLIIYNYTMGEMRQQISHTSLNHMLRTIISTTHQKTDSRLSVVLSVALSAKLVEKYCSSLLVRYIIIQHLSGMCTTDITELTGCKQDSL